MTKPTFIKKLKELFIRFNTSPKLYLKSDFYLLLLLIGGLFENSDESLLGEDGKIEEKYLPTIPTENKEYFPDYAFWLKNYIKKGGECLWIPETVTFSFPTNHKKNKHLWLETDRIHQNSYFEVSAELLQKFCIGQESVEFRFGVTDYKTSGDVVYIYYGPNLQNIVEWSLDNFGILTLPAENILDWLSEGGESIRFELSQSNNFEETPNILFVDFNNIFQTKPSRQKFYIIKWEDAWKIIPLSQVEIKCKYHQLVVKLCNQETCNTIKRNTWREYSEPTITINTVKDSSVKRDICTILDGDKEPIVFEFCGICNNDIYPDVEDVILPRVYFTYERHHYNNRHRTIRQRSSFGWVLHIQGDDANTRIDIFNRLKMLIRKYGSSALSAGSLISRAIGRSDHMLIYMQIPWGYIIKSQSHSWVLRTKTYSYDRNRYKIFYKEKTVCLRVDLLHAGRLVSIALDKTPFIIPKICY